jgi:hypothetical protein
MMKKLLVLALTALLATTSVVGNAAPKVKPYKPTSSFSDRCAIDTKAPKEWSALSKLQADTYRCQTPFRVVAKTLPKVGPKSVASPASALLDANICKIADAGDDRDSKFLGWPATDARKAMFNFGRYPSPKTVFQIVPIEAPDAPAGNQTPMKDYGKYFTWMKNYFSYISDFGSEIEFRVPEKYLKFSKPLKPYNIQHLNKSDFRSFPKDLIAEVDSQIDFAGANITIVLAPAGTPATTFGQQHFQDGVTAEGKLGKFEAMAPATYDLTKVDELNRNLVSPMFWLHNFFHTGVMDFGDGDGEPASNEDKDRAMGAWGVMAQGQIGLLGWQKWLLGFWQDSQVACVNKNLTTTVWLAPEGYRTTRTKLAVIPLSVNKGIVIESMRPAGLEYKLGADEQGALVYVVDTVDRNRFSNTYEVQHDSSAKDNRFDPKRKEFWAPLDKGDSITYEGVKITNVEWGDFGDVIKVEPVAK